MELFIPSVLVLLLAAAVVFFVLPRFGASVLALISVALLVFGIYQHMNAFGTEYRLSTWHLGLMSYAPYVMIGGLLLVIAFYLLSISPLGKANTGTNSATTAPSMPDIPTIAEMPPANTATNAMTSVVNNALKAAGAGTGVGVAGIKNAGNVANGAAVAVNNAINQATNGITNVLNKAKNAIVGNVNANMKNKGANNAKPANNKGDADRVAGLNFPLSQV
jgi:hypothetical protein